MCSRTIYVLGNNALARNQQESKRARPRFARNFPCDIKLFRCQFKRFIAHFHALIAREEIPK